MDNFRAKPSSWMPLGLLAIPVLMALAYWLFGLTVFTVVALIVMLTGAYLYAVPTRAPTGQDHLTRNPEKGS
jgi:uncharacterized membrane protein